MNQPSGRKPSAHWKQSLTFVWLGQFVAMMGFAYALPFVAFFLQQDLGVAEDDLPFWLAMFGAATPLTIIIFAPIWGALADKYGRRMMLLRSYAGAAIVLSLMGASFSPLMLVVLRLMQGVLTGTIAASQTLVATQTPSKHSGFALGSLSSAIFSGSLVGALIGGETAELFGYRTAFYISGVLMLISFLLIYYGVKEKFVPPPPSSKNFFSTMKVDKRYLGVIMPILGLMSAVMFVRTLDGNFIAVLVQEINGSIKGAARLTGILSGICGVAGIVSGFLMGWLADRFSPGWVAIASSLISGILVFPLAFVGSMGTLFLIRFSLTFVGGGVDPVLQLWLSRNTPAKIQGTVFGWAAAARSCGWFLAPLCGGLIFQIWDIYTIFIFMSALFFVLVILIYFVKRKLEIAPSGTTVDS